MNDATFYPSFDGEKLAIHRTGAGHKVILLHGLFSDAQVNWIKFGHAQKLADAGFDVIIPDLRAHGQSAHPHDPAAYPADVLIQDVFSIVETLGLAPGSFDLVGFSLGARTSARAVSEGLAPRRLVLAGMGLEGLGGWDSRAAFFIDAIDRFDIITRDDPAFMARSFMKTQKVDRVAARLLLSSVSNSAAEELARITMPTLVLCGTEDRDNGDPEALARALPDAHLQWIPGTHMSSVTRPELGEALVNFLVTNN
ncbi:MAG: alpha/beta fold hydrolase [Sphingomonadaceae bacterium]